MRNGLLHRDIKPQNIMLRSGNSQAVLIDFGIARDFTPNLTQTHTQMLSDGFAPIEQYDKRAKRGAYSDVYALAATLYAILTGEAPTMSPVRAIGTPLVEPKEINSSISERVNKAIIKGMEIKPENRPQSIQEWLALLSLEVSKTSDVQPSVAQARSLEITSIVIEILYNVPGMTKVRGSHFGVATPIFILRDGTVVKTYTNLFGVDHIFLAHKDKIMIFGGFVGWIHSDGLNKAINRIKKEFT